MFFEISTENFIAKLVDIFINFILELVYSFVHFLDLFHNERLQVKADEGFTQLFSIRSSQLAPQFFYGPAQLGVEGLLDLFQIEGQILQEFLFEVLVELESFAEVLLGEDVDLIFLLASFEGRTHKIGQQTSGEFIGWCHTRYI